MSGFHQKIVKGDSKLFNFFTATQHDINTLKIYPQSRASNSRLNITPFVDNDQIPHIHQHCQKGFTTFPPTSQTKYTKNSAFTFNTITKNIIERQILSCLFKRKIKLIHI